MINFTLFKRSAVAELVAFMRLIGKIYMYIHLYITYIRMDKYIDIREKCLYLCVLFDE
jgi:hypothetical protein